MAEQPGGPVPISMRKVLHVPKLQCNFISERQASLMSELLLVKSPTVTHLATAKDV